MFRYKVKWKKFWFTTLIFIQWVRFQFSNLLGTVWLAPVKLRALLLLLTPILVPRYIFYGLKILLTPRSHSVNADCHVVIISYARQYNILLVARLALSCSFVGKVTICNNNPDVDLSHTKLALDDSRVELLQMSEPTRQGIRLQLAAQSDFPFHIQPDDDMFLTLGHYRRLYDSLKENSDFPVGICGQILVENNSCVHATTRSTWETRAFGFATVPSSSPLLTLNCVYAFTKSQAERAMELCKELQLGPLQNLANGEDILISNAGLEPCHIIDGGRYLNCASSNDPVLATHNGPDFDNQRMALLKKLKGYLPFDYPEQTDLQEKEKCKTA